jgi:hypothetical protein
LSSHAREAAAPQFLPLPFFLNLSFSHSSLPLPYSTFTDKSPFPILTLFGYLQNLYLQTIFMLSEELGKFA